MPTFNIYVSIPRSKIPHDFLSKASGFISTLLDKPESYVCVRISPDQMMSFGGSVEPCGTMELHSIGKLGPQNNCHAAAIAEFIESTLNIPRDRFYVIFNDLGRNDCGLNGKTFA